MMQPIRRCCLLLPLAIVAACGACSAAGDVDTPESIDAGVGVELDGALDAALPAGERCDDAEPITLPGGIGTKRILASTERSGDDYDIAACAYASTSPGPDRVYVVNVAAGHRLIATVKSVVSTNDPAIYLVGGPPAACAAETLTCLAAGDLGRDGDYERVMFRNTGTTAVDVHVIVDGAHAEGGAFRLDIYVDPIPPPPRGETCELAESVVPTAAVATRSGTTSLFRAYEDTYAPGCTPSAEHGNDRVYRVSVPPGQRLEATLTPTFSATLYVLAEQADTCATTCLAGDSGLPDKPAIVTYDNPSDASVDVFVVVDSYRELTGGDYQIDFRLVGGPTEE